MSQKNETVTLVLALLITAGIIGGGFWWFSRKSGLNINGSNTTNQPTNTNQTNNNNSSNNFPPPTNVPSGTTVRIDGSTSMVQINQALKNRFELQFPGTKVQTGARGSNQGIQMLLSGTIDLAAISRPLTSQEQNQGLISVPVTQDAIAIVVGTTNPFRKGLTQAEVVGIFQGQINNWSALGSTNATIRVINRPMVSGTHQAFQELVLKGGAFGTTSNFTMMERDATTPILQTLGKDGISYATYSQVYNQTTVRTVAIDGLTPEAANYPYQRTLYYVYKEPANPTVQAFLGFLGSPLGQETISNTKN